MNPQRLIFLFVFCCHQYEVKAFFQSLMSGFMYMTGGEYCSDRWISFNFHGFQDDLRNNLFGQPLVQESVGYALKAHFEMGDASQKALVLSFHGMQGSGKNFVSDFIIKNIYKKHTKGSKSQFVYFFNGRLMFPLERHVHTYKYQLEETVKNALYKCPNSIFIFDEVDKMPRGVLDVLKPYLDYHYEVQGLVARRAIFIFLSNSGSRAIMEKYLEYWNSGVNRDSLTVNDFDSVIQSGVFNEDGGLQFSDTIAANLIDHYIPFLPLEKSHVRECILREINLQDSSNRKQANREEIIEEVFKAITFGPKPEKLFSNSGCKRISQQVATMMARSRWRSKSEL